MSDLFKGYERDYTRHLTSANKKVSLIPSTPNPDSLIQEARKDVQEAESSLKLMERELASLPPNQASQYQARIKRHNENLAQLKTSLNQEKEKSQRRQLMGGASNDPREKLLGNNEIVQQSGETLENTLRLGLESEQIGSNVMNNLRQQRGQIHKIGDKVNDVGSNLDQANTVITRMDRRRLWMKAGMYLVIILLIIGIGVTVGVKFS